MEQETSIRETIRNWKHGYRALLHMRWAAAFGFHLSVVGLVGVVGIVLAIIRDDKLRKKRKKHLEKICLVPGLQNLGNNCFLNVILQALASCSHFQPFLQKILEKCESTLVEGQCESLPLTITLSDLLEELGMTGESRVALSPHKVMRALTLYIQNFDLTSQQDAAEAFLHLLSSLREEFSDVYLPSQSTLADIFASQSCRILTPERKEDQNEQKRWQQHYLGPFDGIIGSILTCQSCSYQISLDFQFFHSLPLFPVLYGASTIMDGCTLEDCLWQFVLAEKLENYYCSHCWHSAAIKYLSWKVENEIEIEKLMRCSAEDSCDCRNLSCLESLPWSNNFSNTLKQLRIARCPKILCLHLQRASMNEFGELIKLQGHISFPLILDLSPFMTTEVEITNWEGVRKGQRKLQNQKPRPHLNLINVQYETIFNHIRKPMGEKVSSEILVADDSQCTTSLGDSFPKKSKLYPTDCCSKASKSHEQRDDKVSSAGKLPPPETKLYRLVSVVEHFGRSGGGHYTVYRSMRTKPDEEGSAECPDPATTKWFCISDSQVCSVSEKDVLAAEASLLFYERIIEG
ncbi:Ubiquitin carboxyl-terminal hydrolase 27 [Hibiscus syriacus]|uniref:Ubiquitin carboxyl-terminal hydrolase n=2 Tax=Hibiscus syriacus TaxID=106335 RepID=A0A6A2Y9R4_HIBSY|nr:Ubiquitin carboxyl-terminal hydrolase 27 [Hibiscus syriacus]